MYAARARTRAPSCLRPRPRVGTHKSTPVQEHEHQTAGLWINDAGYRSYYGGLTILATVHITGSGARASNSRAAGRGRGAEACMPHPPPARPPGRMHACTACIPAGPPARLHTHACPPTRPPARPHTRACRGELVRLRRARDADAAACASSSPAPSVPNLDLDAPFFPNMSDHADGERRGPVSV